MKDISNFISSVGFPIVVCLLMIYQQEKMSDSYIEIVQSLKELIADNTRSINLLIDKYKKTDTDVLNNMNRALTNQNENKQETSQTISNNK